MFSFQLLLTVNPSLGLQDYSLLSDQALTEMFIDNFDDEAKKRYQDEYGMYLDVCEGLLKWGSQPQDLQKRKDKN